MQGGRKETEQSLLVFPWIMDDLSKKHLLM